MTHTLESFLLGIHPILGNLSGISLDVFLIVSTLTSIFTVGYLIQGTRVWWQLLTTVRQVRMLKGATGKIDPTTVVNIFKGEPLKHLWYEYQDTLHELKKAGNSAITLSEVRATVPA